MTNSHMGPMTPKELKNLRTVARFSQKELGTRIGLRRETIGDMERGDIPIDLRTALAVRYVFIMRADNERPT